MGLLSTGRFHRTGRKKMARLFTMSLLVALVAVLAFLAGRKAYMVPAPGSAVVMTGCSTGIGRDSAIDLAKHGFVVYAGVRKDKDADSLRSLNIPNLVPVILDVTNQETIDSSYEAIVADMDERKIQLGGVVNNAGIFEATPFEFTGLDTVHQLFDVNLYGVIRVTQRYLPLLRATKGRIINVSSMAGFMAIPRGGVYCASKHALEAISDAMRMELKPFDVSVSVIQPGAVVTAIMDKSIQSNDKLDPAIFEVYPHLKPDFKKTEWMLGLADNTDCTSDAIRHALTSEYPWTRYAVANLGGIPASVWKFAVGVLPSRVIDMIMTSTM